MVASVLTQAKSLKRDVRLVESILRHGLKATSLAPGPGQVLDLAMNRGQRLERIRNDDRPDKSWRQLRDARLRPLLPGPVKLIAGIFRRHRRRHRG